MTAHQGAHDGIGHILPHHQQERQHHIVQPLVVVKVGALSQQPEDDTLQLTLGSFTLLLTEI